MKRQRIFFGLLSCLILVIFAYGCYKNKQRLRFAGGPAGGAYYILADSMAAILEEGIPRVSVKVQSTGGGAANLRMIENRQADMAITQAAAFFMGDDEAQGGGPVQFHHVRVMARLYGAAAHLAVLKNSSIKSVEDLKGARIAIGPPGSGAALSAERFFRKLGLWHSIIPVREGYTMAIPDLMTWQVQAVWQTTGIPSVSVDELSQKAPIRLLDLEEAARKVALFDAYPGYSPAVIPAGTYKGINREVRTFQDQEILVAAKELDQQLVYQALQTIYSEQGLRRLRKSHPVAREISLDKGGQLVRFTLHPGAVLFWQEQAQKRGQPQRNSVQ